MQNVYDSQELNKDDLLWSFMGTYSLRGVPGEDNMEVELNAGSLMHTMRNLGVSPEGLEKIAGILNVTVRGAMSHFRENNPNPPLSIRLYCQRSVIPSLRPANSCQHPDPIVNTIKNGGWGFFLIERGRNFLAGSQEGSHLVAELYLYKEG